MRARTPSSSRVEMTQIVMPTHTNGPGGVLFGGTLVQWIHVGDVVVLQAQVNYAARTSMEVGCRVETEHPQTGKRLYTTKAYLTFVATDAEGRPRPVPSIRPVTREE